MNDARSRGVDAGFETRSADWLPFDVARDRVLAAAVLTDPQRVRAAEAMGRALAEPVVASATLPPWDNAAMDGYAVRTADVEGASPAHPAVLRVIEELRAGAVPARAVGPGEASRIMTGAPVPQGADSVVRVEDTDAEAEPGFVRVVSGRDAGRNVRPGGEDMQPGDLLLAAGDTVRAGTVGVLAAAGVDEVVVRRRPEVAIVPTGDELRRPERYDDVRTGRGIPESNGPMIAAAVAEAGGVPHLLPPVEDRPQALEEALERVGAPDLLVTLGGASMGEADLVKRVLDRRGFVLDFWRVAIRPGSPVGFGRLPVEGRDVPVLSLPGNPASAFVTFELFGRPFLRRSAGHRAVLRPILRCRAGEELRAPAPLTFFLRVRIDAAANPWSVTSTGPQGSGLVRGLAAADGLAVIPADRTRIAAGEEVDVMLLGAPPLAAPASGTRGTEGGGPAPGVPPA